MNNTVADELRKGVREGGFSFSAETRFPLVIAQELTFQPIAVFIKEKTRFEVAKVNGHYIVSATGVTSEENFKANSVSVVEVHLNGQRGLSYKILEQKRDHAEPFPISVNISGNSLRISSFAADLTIRNEGKALFEVHQNRVGGVFGLAFIGMTKHVRLEEDKNAENGFAVKSITKIERLRNSRVFDKIRRAGDVVEIRNEKLKVPA
ncbi:MAG: hypothetical protein ABSD68_03870 [Candidatus Micrarchaeales archaeon]